MSGRNDLAREAARMATKFRQRLQIDRVAPVCACDVAEKLGVQVQLMSLPSAEGVYCRDRGPAIIISTERPPGRQNFTCAHELGHHVFGHGTRSDEYLEDRHERSHFDPEEFLADVFAGHFLMSAAAVREAFGRRGVGIESAESTEVFAVAGWLGVGYTTLIDHLQIGLEMITARHAATLRRSSPKAIRDFFLGANDIQQLVIAGSEWLRRPIDLRVGDGVLLPQGSLIEGDKLALHCLQGKHVLAVASRSGLARIEHPETNWSCFVRVMKRDYEGLGRFRFEEEDTDEHSVTCDNC